MHATLTHLAVSITLLRNYISSRADNNFASTSPLFNTFGPSTSSHVGPFAHYNSCQFCIPLTLHYKEHFKDDNRLTFASESFHSIWQVDIIMSDRGQVLRALREQNKWYNIMDTLMVGRAVNVNPTSPTPLPTPITKRRFRVNDHTGSPTPWEKNRRSVRL